MSYHVISDFRLGLDRRKHILGLPPGSLYELDNGHITTGGEIEKRRAFVSKYTLPASTFGMLSAAGLLYVFGSGVDPGVPAGVIYQRLQHPEGLSMTDLVKGSVFNNKVFALARFSNNKVLPFYDGAVVHDWYDGIVIASMTNNSGIATALAALVDADSDYSASAAGAVITITGPAGAEFTCVGSTVNGGAVNNQTAAVVVSQTAIATIPAVAATGRVVIGSAAGQNFTAITVNGVNVLGSTVTWIGTSSDFASELALRINQYASTPEYSAEAQGGIVVITAADAGVAANGFVVAYAGTASGGTDNMSGGVDEVAGRAQIVTVTIGGTFEVGDAFTIQITQGPNIKTFGAGRVGGQQATTALTHKDKIYVGAGSNLIGSGIRTPLGWNAEDIGSFITDMAGQAERFETVLGLGVFLNNLAILARRCTQIVSVDPDPSLNNQIQVLPNIGTVSGKSVTNYGDSDVFFLADSGIRSLRPHQFITLAGKTDVGTAIDALVTAALKSLGETIASQAPGEIDPESGRFWLALGPTVYVYSFFPESKITAWSTYSPGFSITDFAVVGTRIYARSGNTIYLYGGDDNATYDTSTLLIRLPYLTAKMLATIKHFTGIDLTTDGEFTAYIGTDANQPNEYEEVAILEGTTLGLGAVPINGEAEMFSLKLTHSKAEYAKLAHAVVHYEPLGAS